MPRMLFLSGTHSYNSAILMLRYSHFISTTPWTWKPSGAAPERGSATRSGNEISNGANHSNANDMTECSGSQSRAPSGTMPDAVKSSGLRCCQPPETREGGASSPSESSKSGGIPRTPPMSHNGMAEPPGAFSLRIQSRTNHQPWRVPASSPGGLTPPCPTLSIAPFAIPALVSPRLTR